MTTASTAQPPRIRPPAVAGTFYPGQADKLAQAVRQYFAEADSKIATTAQATGAPKAIIAPHAGYIYSGLTAAAAYRSLAPARDVIKRVVMMGPCHRVAVHGLALPSVDAFRTPLGDVAIDKRAVTQIAALPQVQIFDATHKDDHALEVHLPFLQTVLADFKIVPMIVGQATVDEVAQVLDILWGGAETLILISSDLSHYLPYQDAQKTDDSARRAIESFDGAALGDAMACGRHSIKGLLKLAQERRMSVNTADVRNSGDTAGPKDRVVGYGSWLFYETPGAVRVTSRPAAAAKAPASLTIPIAQLMAKTTPPAIAQSRHKAVVTPNASKTAEEDSFGNETRTLLDRHGPALLKLAAGAIVAALDGKLPFLIKPGDYAPELNEKGAAFVTIDKDHHLRGCIGSVVAHRPLLTDIAENACKAAFQDPRFPPLTRAEIAASHISLHISVLSPQVPMRFTSEHDLLAQLRPGRDGLILQDQGKRGVFLPVVWDTIPDPKKFLDHLKRKAGLPESHWSSTVQVWRYVTEGVESDALPAGTDLWSTS